MTSGTAACLLPLRLFGDHGAFDPVLRVIALADSCRGERPLDHISSEMLRAANDPNRLDRVGDLVVDRETGGQLLRGLNSAAANPG